MTRLLSWTARLLAIAGILFISLFALDVPSSEKPWHEVAIALFMHLLPSFVLITCLVVAWRKAWMGGVLFVAAGLAPFVLLSNPNWVNLMLGGPFILAGLSFLASHGLRSRGG